MYAVQRHAEPRFNVSHFLLPPPKSGEYVASGSFDKCLHIWSVKDGQLVRTYRGKGGIFEVCWNKDGDKVAACFSNNTVVVLDFKSGRPM